MNNSSSSLYTFTAESLVTAAAVVGVVGAAHRELGGEQHHGEQHHQHYRLRAAPGQLRTKIFLAMKLIR